MIRQTSRSLVCNPKRDFSFISCSDSISVQRAICCFVKFFSLRGNQFLIGRAAMEDSEESCCSETIPPDVSDCTIQIRCDSGMAVSCLRIYHIFVTATSVVDGLNYLSLSLSLSNIPQKVIEA